MPKPKRRPTKATPGPFLKISLFNGRRELFDPTKEILLRIRDGLQKEAARFLKGNIFHVSVAFHDNLADNYTVLASTDGYYDVGFFPVKISASGDTAVDLMLIPKRNKLTFADWPEVLASYPYICQFIGCGLQPPDAQARYEQLKSDKPNVLAALLNLTVAMSQIHLRSGTPLDYIKLLKWDQSMAQDRFFAYCDPELINEVELAVKSKIFTPEPGPGLFHPGATRSYKQKQFGEANVQLTFHEGDKNTIGGVECIAVEPDIDYYQDLGAHTLFEVIPNTLTHGLTDPRTAYVLRWVAGRQAGFPEFNPPYTIDELEEK